jgi:hypothetical protein
MASSHSQEMSGSDREALNTGFATGTVSRHDYVPHRMGSVTRGKQRANEAELNSATLISFVNTLASHSMRY